jgi:hypothetical protein
VLVQQRYEKVRMRFLSRFVDFVHRPEFLITRIHDVSDTGCFRLQGEEGDTYYVESLRKS